VVQIGSLRKLGRSVLGVEIMSNIQDAKLTIYLDKTAREGKPIIETELHKRRFQNHADRNRTFSKDAV
jgi:hypothetical protein